MAEIRERTRIQLVVFTLNQVEFAVPIEQVWRVEPLAEHPVTWVPRAPAFLEGVVNVRGQVIPVLDLKKRFGFAATEQPPRARLLIVEMGTERTALIVDAVSDIRWFPTSKVEAPPPMVAQISGVFVQGVGKEDERLLIILDLREVLSPAERQELQEIGS
jgi:purine-binding chemotaxis protein CheW